MNEYISCMQFIEYDEAVYPALIYVNAGPFSLIAA